MDIHSHGKSELMVVVDLIGDIVTKVAAKWDRPEGQPALAPFYMYGHPVEIVNELQKKSKHPTGKINKFPLIALFQDFEERRGENQANEGEVSLNLIIATYTKAEYLSSQRYQVNFKPILIPIYELLLDEIVKSMYFNDISFGLIPHTKTDRVYWGKQGLYGSEGNIFNDRIDAIEITDLNLKIKNHIYKC
jgi:hypothetical protein